MRLLADIRDAFDELRADHLATARLLDWLRDLDEAPWSEWFGKPISARGLARLLEPYRVRPIQRRIAGSPQRGYFRSEFEDAWQRYVPAQSPGTSGTSGTSGAGVTDVPDVPSVQPESEADPMEQLRLDRRQDDR
jgi:hypothetical protein